MMQENVRNRRQAPLGFLVFRQHRLATQVSRCRYQRPTKLANQ
jgi:hypothetical protein